MAMTASLYPHLWFPTERLILNPSFAKAHLTTDRPYYPIGHQHQSCPPPFLPPPDSDDLLRMT